MSSLEQLRADLRSGARSWHPALTIAREDTRAALARLMRAYGEPLVLATEASKQLLQQHSARALARQRGDRWIEVACFLSDPERYLARRLEQPQDEVIGPRHEVGDSVNLRGDAASLPLGWGFGESAIEVGAAPPVLQPAVVTGQLLEQFAGGVELGYQSLSRDAVAHGGDPFNPPAGKSLSVVFIKEYTETAIEWSKLYQLLVAIRRGEVPSLVLPSYFWPMVEKFRQLLSGFRDRYQAELGEAPSGGMPTGPAHAGPDPTVPVASFWGSAGPGSQLKDAAVALAILAALIFLARR